MMFAITTLLCLLAGVIATLTLKRQRPGLATRLWVPIGGVWLVLTLLQSVAVVPAGHVGVMDTFGHVSDRTLPPGLNLVSPVTRVITLSTRTQELTEQADVPSSEGLVLKLDASLLFNLSPANASRIYRNVGPKYVETIVIPQFRSHLREATASHEAKALYTSGRELVAVRVQRGLDSTLSTYGVENARVLLRAVRLPQEVAGAIETKLRFEQESEQMRFVLDREKQEAERKRVEAQGIADFQRIVSQGIDERLLRWKGIEATEKLASSPNTKIVVVGGKDGLPLIMNPD